MPEVTNELIYEVLTSVQTRLGNLENGVRDVRTEIAALRGHTLAIQQDVGNIYDKLAVVETRIERIEANLDIVRVPTT